MIHVGCRIELGSPTVAQSDELVLPGSSFSKDDNYVVTPVIGSSLPYIPTCIPYLYINNTDTYGVYDTADLAALIL